MAKIIIGFVAGAATMFIAWSGVQFAYTAQASAEEEGGLSSLIPDIVKINREALVTPLREAEKTIWDKEISDYYHLLLGRAGFLEDTTAASTQSSSTNPQ